MFNLTPPDIEAILLSFKVAISATVLATPFGFATAHFLVFSNMRGKSVVEGIINLPLVLPPVVIGYLLLLLLGQRGLAGPVLEFFDIRIVFTLAGAIVASTVVGFPLMVRSIKIGLESIDLSTVKVSRTLGASWWDSLLTIILPLSMRAVFAGMTLMFARSLGEFGATVILAGNIPGVTQTIPLAIYQYTSTPGGDKMALSLCFVSICLSFGALFFSEMATKRIPVK